MGAVTTHLELPEHRPCLAVVGAGGSIGEQLCRRLSSRYRVVAITGLGTRVHAADPDGDIEWRFCDFFSLTDMEQVLSGASSAIFLAHSGLPNAKLEQAYCSDMDLLMAENFARAAESLALEHIVCLRYLLPPEPEQHDEIQRRHRQVAAIVSAHATPVTVIHTGLVVEPSSAMIRLIRSLVKRSRYLPVPEWSRHRMQPIAIEDLARAFAICLQEPATFTGDYDIGGPEVLDWRQLLERIAGLLATQPKIVSPDRISPATYARWVRRVRPIVHKEALKLFVSNLQYDRVVTDNPLQRALQPDLSPALAGLHADDEDDVRQSVRFRRKLIAAYDEQMQNANTVRSIQRVSLPQGRTLSWLSRRYFTWLAAYMSPFIRCVDDAEGSVCIRLTGLDCCLLRLEKQRDRSTPRRQMYWIAGGVLASRKLNQRGRMEFRQLAGGNDAVIAIHDFAPALPWRFYLATQAAFHHFVMRAFQRHIESRHR
jgi:uncharacterized protein YbjT (DUF2867 family)